MSINYIKHGACLIFLMVFYAISSNLDAQIYKCQEKNRIIYSDKPCKNEEKEIGGDQVITNSVKQNNSVNGRINENQLQYEKYRIVLLDQLKQLSKLKTTFVEYYYSENMIPTNISQYRELNEKLARNIRIDSKTGAIKLLLDRQVSQQVGGDWIQLTPQIRVDSIRWTCETNVISLYLPECVSHNVKTKSKNNIQINYSGSNQSQQDLRKEGYVQGQNSLQTSHIAPGKISDKLLNLQKLVQQRNKKILNFVKNIEKKYFNEELFKHNDLVDLRFKNILHLNLVTHNAHRSMRYRFHQNLVSNTPPMTWDETPVEFQAPKGGGMKKIIYYPGFGVSVFLLPDSTKRKFGGANGFISYPHAMVGATVTKCETDMPKEMLDWCFNKNDFSQVQAIPLPHISPETKHKYSQWGLNCKVDTSTYPDDFEVMIVGSSTTRLIDYQIESKYSSSSSAQTDVIVNAPGRSIALILAGYTTPKLWNIQWTKGTRIVGVFVSGLRKQYVSGTDTSAISVTYSDAYNDYTCGRLEVSKHGNNYMAQYMSNNIFGKYAENIYFGKSNKPLIVGQPIDPNAELMTNPDNSAIAWLETRPFAGYLALEKSIESGVIRPATQKDAEHWAASRTKAIESGRSLRSSRERNHIVNGIENYYVILKEFTIPSGLTVVPRLGFIVKNGAPLPEEKHIHSMKIYDMNTLKCHGCY